MTTEIKKEHTNISRKSVFFIETENSPEPIIYSILQEMKNKNISQSFCVCKVHFHQTWNKKKQILELIYKIKKIHGELEIEKFSLSDTLKSFTHEGGEIKKLEENTITVNFDSKFYLKIKKEFDEGKNIFVTKDLFLLNPVFIPKPWGQEIWYTGVEERGVSLISPSLSQQSILLPWFFAALPKTFLGEKYFQKNLILIKILDPLPEEVKGDLYYEMHQEKNEVYVVTHIAPHCGQIKMGMSPQKLEQYKNNVDELKANFLKAIEEYEVIRRKIDDKLSVLPKKEISKELEEQEKDLRLKMDSFSGYLNLKVGDVIRVPTHLPHALQHGVRVVEFQTPTYERLIISFAQKVLTQSHWDTKKAFELMTLLEPQKSQLKICEQTKNILLEFVCEFPDFYSLRLTLNRKASYKLKKAPFYQILFCVQGQGQFVIHGKKIAIENGMCFFVPAKAGIEIETTEGLVLLICAPEKSET